MKDDGEERINRFGIHPAVRHAHRAVTHREIGLPEARRRMPLWAKVLLGVLSVPVVAVSVACVVNYFSKSQPSNGNNPPVNNNPPIVRYLRDYNPNLQSELRALGYSGGFVRDVVSLVDNEIHRRAADEMKFIGENASYAVSGVEGMVKPVLEGGVSDGEMSTVLDADGDGMVNRTEINNGTNILDKFNRLPATIESLAILNDELYAVVGGNDELVYAFTPQNYQSLFEELKDGLYGLTLMDYIHGDRYYTSEDASKALNYKIRTGNESLLLFSGATPEEYETFATIVEDDYKAVMEVYGIDDGRMIATGGIGFDVGFDFYINGRVGSSGGYFKDFTADPADRGHKHEMGHAVNAALFPTYHLWFDEGMAMSASGEVDAAKSKSIDLREADGSLKLYKWNDALDLLISNPNEFWNRLDFGGAPGHIMGQTFYLLLDRGGLTEENNRTALGILANTYKSTSVQPDKITIQYAYETALDKSLDYLFGQLMIGGINKFYAGDNQEYQRIRNEFNN